jgi:pilus assembly protein CpaD
MSKMSMIKPAAAPLVIAIALAVTGCKHTEGEQVLGWSLVDPAQRHPIMVTQAPTYLDIEVLRGRNRLMPDQRAQIVEFVQRYKRENSTGKLVIAAPSGAPNEVAAVSVAGAARNLVHGLGISWGHIDTEPYTAEDGNPQPPLRLSYVKQTAEAPECGRHPANMAGDSRNLPYHDLGCSTQANLAAMVDNPQDLLTARAQSTPRDSTRRDVIWEKYTKGDETGAKKSADERVKVKEQ